MKSKQSAILFLIAVLSLTGIAAVVGMGIFKNKPKPIQKTEDASVLGEAQSKISPTSSLDFNRIVSDTYQNTKEAAKEKVQEVQKTVMSTVENEITTLTKSQVDAMKLQICRDWGVISISPTKSP